MFSVPVGSVSVMLLISNVHSTGEFGELLGTSPLNAGTNADVLVQLDVNTASTLAAVIYEGDLQDPTMASNWIELDISEDS